MDNESQKTKHKTYCPTTDDRAINGCYGRGAVAAAAAAVADVDDCEYEDDDEEEETLDPTLNSLFDCNSLQWVFVGGKGGVGKTTTSCSIAIELAKSRENVLILSTDPAHNLSDAFNQNFSSAPIRVNGFTNLYAMELSTNIQDTNSGFKLNSSAAGGGGGGLMDSSSNPILSSSFLPSSSTSNPSSSSDSGVFGKLLPELFSAIPGIDEALGFAELMNSVRSMKYSVIVFDTAPTGHTLRLINFPQLLDKGLTKLSQLREKMAGALNMVSGLIDEDDLHNKLDSLRALTASVKSQFQDPSKTTFVCVCIPEFLSVYETERLVQELAKHNIDCCNIVVNQVLFPIEEAEAIRIDEDLIKSIAEESSGETCAAADLDQSQLEARLKNALNLALRKVELLNKNITARRRMQSKYLNQIEELYAADFHVVPVPLQTREIRGKEDLEKFAQLLKTIRELPILSK